MYLLNQTCHPIQILNSSALYSRVSFTNIIFVTDRQVIGLSGATTPTVNGEALAIKVGKVDQVISVGTAKVVKTDIKCSNGIIHVIDSVMMPKA